VFRKEVYLEIQQEHAAENVDAKEKVDEALKKLTDSD
jgi:sRNA-binding carbon storage regulator CsrA